MERRVFFVTGLPRSRTAWLANFLSLPPRVACRHDLLGRHGAVEGAVETWLGEAPAKVVGISDSAAGLWAAELAARWPAARVLVVHRSGRAVVQSLVVRLGLDLDTAGAIVRQAGEAARAMVAAFPAAQVRGLDFGRLSDVAKLRGIWRFLVGDAAPFDEERARELVDMRIEKTKGALLRDACARFSTPLEGGA
jgi:hypothetical protein